MANKDKGIALILGMGKPRPEEPEDDSDDLSEARTNCAATMIDCVESGDAEGLAQALSDFLEMR